MPSPAGPAGFGIKIGEEVQGGRVTGRGARGRPSRQKHHGGGKTKQENRVCFSVLKNRPVLFCAEGKRAVFSFLAPPPRLRQMRPTLAYVKEDCCISISTLGSTQLKLSAGPVARTPPFQPHLLAHLHLLQLHLLHPPPAYLTYLLLDYPRHDPPASSPTHSRRTPHAAAAPSPAACLCPAPPCC